ncbi:ribonucleotide-diphosphate reductase subunit beta [Bacillus sp. M6-12]|uniref:R2-like ligand-binding oxidase n=1 Tax=Bacillus sp. M6-12 TaxID=2054166 RepID=UPI000C790CF5|nr:R2-like ligand-binding oxidase [Bacillus sp. M6-12]PLS16031.1 ribonucleotide-diphosphate reductase subunit beta [Bacillus sp. M6-12]
MSISQDRLNYEQVDKELEHIQDLNHEDRRKADELAYSLYRMAIRFGTWDPQEIDLTEDKKHFATMDQQKRDYLIHFCTGFWNAEENVAVQFCPWVMVAPTTHQQAFLSTQLVEEFKHTEFFERYFKEVLGVDRENKVQNIVHDTLDPRGKQLIQAIEEGPESREAAMVEGMAHYQGIIEGVQAMVGYDVYEAVWGQYNLLPGLREAFKNIKRDEGRHVGFGLRMLKQFSRKPEHAERIRRVYEEYLPAMLIRYDQQVIVNGREIETPVEVQGKDRIQKMFDRRLKDILGNQLQQV